MKITKLGKIPPPKVFIYIGKCNYCKTEMEASLDEIRTKYNSCYGYPTETNFHGDCPLCKQDVKFKQIEKEDEYGC